MIWVLYALFGIGVFFQAIGVLGLFRFPDVYTRLHGTTICTTFGSIFIYAGIILYGIMNYLSGSSDYAILSVHTFVAMVMIMVTNAAGSHAIARAAHRSGVMPKKAVVDRLKEAGG